MPVSHSPPPLHEPHSSAPARRAPKAGNALRLVTVPAILLAMMALGALAGFSFTPDARRLLDLVLKTDTGLSMDQVRAGPGILSAPAGRILRLRKDKGAALILPLPGNDGEDLFAPATSLMLFLRPASGKLPSARQMAALYRHEMQGSPRRTNMGLAEYHFRPGSPYADITLYVGRKAGRVIFIRCRKQADAQGVRMCESAFSPYPGLRVTWMFDARHLPRWSALETTARQAILHHYRQVRD